MSLDDSFRKLLELRIRAGDPAGPIRLTLVGELDDEEGGHLRDVVAEVVRADPGRPVELSCSGLTFLNSAGIRALLRCSEHAAGHGGRLSITEISPIGHQVLRITDLLEVFGSPAVRMTTSRDGTAAALN